MFEDDLKNRSRDIASGSLVFSRPKIGGASGKNYNLKIKLKCLPVADERCVHS